MGTTMTMLDIDTDELRSAVAVAKSANEEITAAMDLLNKIVVHNDWECPQRETIKDNTINNRQTAKNIQECANALYLVIEEASVKFENTEQEIIRLTNQVDSIIASVASIVPGAYNDGGSSPSMVPASSVKGAVEG